MANPTLVSQNAAPVDSYASNTTKDIRVVETTTRSTQSPSTRGPNDNVCFTLIQQSLRSRGFSKETIDIILQSWRPSTKKQYASSIEKWLRFCTKRAVDPVHATVTVAMEFLTKLVHSGAKYSTVNTARCALSSLLWSTSDNKTQFGSHPLVIRFMRGLFNLKPQYPRYSHTWDVGILLRYVSKMEPLQSIALKQLTYKLICLCALTTAQRAQTLSLFDISNMKVRNKQVCIKITDLIKTFKPGKPQPQVILSAYPHDKSVCVMRTLLEYLKRTRSFRGSKSKLFLSYTVPHKEIGTATVSRWLKQSLTEAGVDVSEFKAHSFRTASTSAAANKGVPINLILQTAGWASSTTFAKFYNRSDSILCSEGAQSQFSQAILSQK
ncbi:uncharacterized protein LOC119719320 [Patiria miniata]|uniref:Tyr recombinase domain-containing protein n=1 Tax=Patiria miniata TaxID=46514 RepID=A0A913YZ32_PATMI|nr:uncharacterized protein LOC119719320 [Patiria miniata]XP_038044663.1 uncharacterized protein LOC119719320 [Patiria miniata]